MKWIRRIFRKLFSRPNPNPIVRHDLLEFRIEENLNLLVHWKTLDIGKGPAVVLQAFEKEILKFDCFGTKKGHYHISPHYDFRIYFVEETVPDQISRSIKELIINGLRYLKSQKDIRFDSFQLHESSFHSILIKVEKALNEFYRTVPELSE